MNLTLEYLRRLFQEFFSSHSQVNHFHYGVIEEYMASKEDKDYISVNIEFTGTQFDEIFSDHTYTITISDLFNQNYPEMEHSVVSNTAQIMRDFLSFLRDMDFTFTSGNIQPFREESNDFTAGVVMVLGIQVPNQLNECSIPGYSQFLNSSSYAPVDRVRPSISINSEYAISSSYALTASYALNALVSVNTGSLVTTSSFNFFTSSYNTGSFRGQFSGSFTGSFIGDSLDISGSAIIRNTLQVNTGGINSTVGIFGSDTSINSIGVGLYSGNIGRWRLAMVANRHLNIQRADSAGNYTTQPSIRIFHDTGHVSLNSTTDTTDDLYVNGSVRFDDRISLGGTGLLSTRLAISGQLSGSSTSYGVYQYGSIHNSVTTNGIGFRSQMALSANTSLSNVVNFWATRGADGASATSLTTIGFWANNDLGINSPGTAYGFLGSINSSGSLKWNLYMQGSAANFMAGVLHLGAASGLRRFNFYNNLALTGDVTTYANYTNGIIQSDSTTAANGYASQLGIVAGGSVSALAHFTALQGGFGAGSTVSQQTGYDTGDLNGGVINIAFRGRLSAGTNKWNIYNEGTANNYLRGNLMINTLTSSSFALDVNGAMRATQGIIITYTPTGSTDPTLPTGSICADDNFLYRRNGSGTWMKMGWQAF